MTFDPVLPVGWIIVLLLPPTAFIVWQIVRAGGSRARISPIRRLVAVALLGLSAAGPAIPGGTTTEIRSDVDVFIVMDTTTSSNAEDYGDGRTRLDLMKDDVRAITEQYGGARYSLITFDSAAQVRVPLIADPDALLSLVQTLQVEITDYSNGSTPYQANDLLADRLAASKKDHPSRVRVVFYLGDGEQTATVDGTQTFEASKGQFDAGSVLGYGTAQGGPMRENSPEVFVDDQYDEVYGDGDPSASPSAPSASPTEPPYLVDPATGQPAISTIDERNLKQIASDLGVGYQHRVPNTQPTLPDVGDRIGEKVEVKKLTIVERLYWIPAIAAFLLIAWELFIGWRQLAELRTAKPKKVSS
ncbi:VWA domain-containing protein [Schumannella sp. 10F1B-5-1]|uniref:vWA domain-containing protein n=1 Tax=Schumannella sp. 10F1B-5-1 TaxID=2590780 RepID=UPI00112FFDAE|nr:VWA domain-containing protein [Schumannella sp. 10F1B-5-1]TPW70720.1 VWA domain-containing protein [Schumannella sp. 10F1B-5-1]